MSCRVLSCDAEDRPKGVELTAGIVNRSARAVRIGFAVLRIRPFRRLQAQVRRRNLRSDLPSDWGQEVSPRFDSVQSFQALRCHT
jgi:hypothetical protein